VDLFDSCSTTRTLVIGSSFCERFPFMLVWIDKGGGNEYEKVDLGSETDMLSWLTEWADPLPASMSSNSISERLPASMSVSPRLFGRRIFRKNAMTFRMCLLCLVPSYT
jgi:hypothetical protein